jgi:hypothetical protein
VGGVWKDIWTSLKTVVAATASAVAFGLAILGSLWDPGIKIQIGLIWLAVVAFAIISVLATAIKMAIEARRAAHGGPPRAVYAYVSTAGEGAVTLIMGRSRQFGVNILVIVYYEERLEAGRGETFERKIGIGRVVNIQENGLIQVLVLREVSNHSELWQRVRNHEIATLSGIVIKPSIDFNAIGIEGGFDE